MEADGELDSEEEDEDFDVRAAAAAADAEEAEEEAEDEMDEEESPVRCPRLSRDKGYETQTLRPPTGRRLRTRRSRRCAVLSQADLGLRAPKEVHALTR